MAKAKRVSEANARRVLAALEKTGGHQRKAAQLVGVSPRRLQQIVMVMRNMGLDVPKSPHDLTPHFRPDDHNIRGKSTLLGPDGEIKLQWVKEQATTPSPAEMAEIIKRTKIKLDQKSKDWLIRMANGDARQALTLLEATQSLYGKVDQATMTEALQSTYLRYDKAGEEHYNTISAYIKSMRASDVDAALYSLLRPEWVT